MAQKKGFLSKAFDDFTRDAIVKPLKKRARKEFKAFKKREKLEGLHFPKSLREAVNLGTIELKKSGFKITKVKPELPKVPLPK